MGKWIFSAVLALSACAQDEHKHVGHSHGAGTSGRKQLCNGFMPENDMWIPEDPSKVHAYAVTRAQFDSVLNRLYSLYASEIARRGAQLVIERNWSDGTVNAYAYREGGNWIISMFGGFARHPSITYDGFASVACHELGHHLGGAPLYSGDWASVEGQSDYYATNKCLQTGPSLCRWRG